MYIDVASISLFILVGIGLSWGVKYYQFRSGASYKDPTQIEAYNLTAYGLQYQNGTSGFPKNPSIAKKYFLEATKHGHWEAYFYLADSHLNEDNNAERACWALQPSLALIDLEDGLKLDSLTENTKLLAGHYAETRILKTLYSVCGNPWSAKIKHDKLCYSDSELDLEYEFKEVVENRLQAEIDELLPDTVDKKNLIYHHSFVDRVYDKFIEVCKEVEAIRDSSANILKNVELPRKEVLKKLEKHRGEGTLVKTLTYEACEEAIEYLSAEKPTIEVPNFDPNEKPLGAGRLIDMLFLMQRFVQKNPEKMSMSREMPSEEAFLEMDVEKVREDFFEYLIDKGVEIDRQGYDALVHSDQVISNLIQSRVEKAEKKLKKFIKGLKVSRDKL